MVKWERLPKKWQQYLLSNNFLIRDVKGDGNCQFRSINVALRNSEQNYSHLELRNLLANYIRNMEESKFIMIIENYKEEKENNQFEGEWDPNEIQTQEDLAKEIEKPGFNYEGDDITLSLLTDILSIDFVIFDNYNVFNVGNNHNKFIILYRESDNTCSGHYNIIGFENDDIRPQTIFYKTDLPNELKTILDTDTLYTTHLQILYHSIRVFSVKNIFNYFKKFKTLNAHEKTKIRKISKDIVENEYLSGVFNNMTIQPPKELSKEYVSDSDSDNDSESESENDDSMNLD